MANSLNQVVDLATLKADAQQRSRMKPTQDFGFVVLSLIDAIEKLDLRVKQLGQQLRQQQGH